MLLRVLVLLNQYPIPEGKDFQAQRAGQHKEKTIETVEMHPSMKGKVDLKRKFAPYQATMDKFCSNPNQHQHEQLRGTNPSATEIRCRSGGPRSYLSAKAQLRAQL